MMVLYMVNNNLVGGIPTNPINPTNPAFHSNLDNLSNR